MASENTKRREIFSFTVEGAGAFPFDMLRYDSCWPFSGEDSAMLEQHERNRRLVVLCSANAVGEPTKARWDSFNWRVVGLGNLRGQS